MQNRATFLGAFLEGIITWFAVFLFFSDFPLTTFLFLLASHLVLFRLFKTPLPALFGGFFAGIVTEIVVRRTFDGLTIIRDAVIAAVFIQAVIIIIAHLAGTVLDPASSISQNMLFAFIGCLIYFNIQTAACGIQTPTRLPQDLNIMFLDLDTCLMQDVVMNTPLERPIVFANFQPTIQFFEDIFSVIYKLILLASPIGLASFLAVFRQVALKTPNRPGIGYFAKHYLGVLSRFLFSYVRCVLSMFLLVALLSALRLSSNLLGLPNLTFDGRSLRFELSYSHLGVQLELYMSRLIGIILLSYVVASYLKKSADRERSYSYKY